MFDRALASKRAKSWRPDPGLLSNNRRGFATTRWDVDEDGFMVDDIKRTKDGFALAEFAQVPLSPQAVAALKRLQAISPEGPEVPDAIHPDAIEPAEAFQVEAWNAHAHLPFIADNYGENEFDVAEAVASDTPATVDAQDTTAVSDTLREPDSSEAQAPVSATDDGISHQSVEGMQSHSASEGQASAHDSLSDASRQDASASDVSPSDVSTTETSQDIAIDKAEDKAQENDADMDAAATEAASDTPAESQALSDMASAPTADPAEDTPADSDSPTVASAAAKEEAADMANTVDAVDTAHAADTANADPATTTAHAAQTADAAQTEDVADAALEPPAPEASLAADPNEPAMAESELTDESTVAPDEMAASVEDVVDDVSLPAPVLAGMDPEVAAQREADKFAEGLAQGLAEGERQARAAMEQEVQAQCTVLANVTQELHALLKDAHAFYEPMKRLSLHLAEQIVKAELQTSTHAIEQLIQRCLDALDQPAQGLVVLELNPQDKARLQAQNPELIRGMRLEAVTDMPAGSVRLFANDAVIEDLITHRLQSLAQSLLVDVSAWQSQSALTAPVASTQDLESEDVHP